MGREADDLDKVLVTFSASSVPYAPVSSAIGTRPRRVALVPVTTLADVATGADVRRVDVAWYQETIVFL